MLYRDEEEQINVPDLKVFLSYRREDSAGYLGGQKGEIRLRAI